MPIHPEPCRVQAAIEATAQIAELSSATATHAFGPTPWTAAATTGAKPPIANPICVPIVMCAAAHGC